MKFLVDDYFCIGSDHVKSGKPCQDYACSGNAGDVGVAIISDGCSTGGRTDVGSRITALSMLTVINDSNLGISREAHRDIFERLKIRQKANAASLELNECDLYATCIYSLLFSRGGYVGVFGDGVVAFKYQDGRIKMYSFEWNKNTPFYPSYVGNDLRKFINLHSCESDLPVTCEEWNYYPKSGFCNGVTNMYTVDEGVRGIGIEITEKMLLDDGLEFVSVFSDGMNRIDAVDWRDAVCELMAFKGRRGEFLKRRMMRAVRNYQKKGNSPRDDLSCATIQVVR
ncbi:protein phosphatase 2C domain-containing protein [Patescibacteria group bacterium]